MKFSSTLFLLTAPLLVSANVAAGPRKDGEPIWTYNLGGKLNHGDKGTGCNKQKLNKATDWSWESKASNCQLFMFGDTACTGKDGLNFQTRANKDRGNAQTDHLAWKVKC